MPKLKGPTFRNDSAGGDMEPPQEPLRGTWRAAQKHHAELLPDVKSNDFLVVGRCQQHNTSHARVASWGWQGDPLGTMQTRVQ